jgi:hypothetical protein
MFDDVKFFFRIRADSRPSTESGSNSDLNAKLQTFISSRLAYATENLGKPASDIPQVVNMIRSITFSKILFLYATCPSMSVTGLFSRYIAMSLRSSLEIGFSVPESPVIWKPELLCWVLMAGAVTVQDQAYRAWFLRRIEDFLALHSIEEFTQLVNMLKEIMWEEENYPSACQRVWDDVLKRKQQNNA